LRNQIINTSQLSEAGASMQLELIVVIVGPEDKILVSLHLEVVIGQTSRVRIREVGSSQFDVLEEIGSVQFIC
jgi:hypothetical protein